MLRTFVCQSGLVVVLAALTLPALLLATPPDDGPLSSMRLPLTLTLVEVVWIIFLLPFNVHPKQVFRRTSTFTQAAVAGIVLAVPLVFITGRMTGVSLEFLLGSQALVVAAALVAVPLARIRVQVWYLSGAMAILFLPLLVREFASDLAGGGLKGVPGAISPVAALRDAYPHAVPTAGIAAMLGIAAIVWAIRLALPRGVLGFILAVAIIATGAGVSDGTGPDLVGIRSPLDGHFRPGMMASMTLDLRNPSDHPLDGEIRVVTEGGGCRAPVRIGPGAEGEAHLRLFLPTERPAFQVRYSQGGETAPVPDLEGKMTAYLRPLGEPEILIGWIGEFPEPMQEILGNIAATQVRLPEVLGPGWEGLEAVDLIVVARPLGEETAGTIRRWQAHGGKVLSLSAEASEALGAPRVTEPGEIALRRRGEGILATLDLQGDRGALFERARAALEIDRRTDPTPASVIGPDLFPSATLGLSGRRAMAGWIIAYTALATASGWVLAHHRVVAQVVLAALILGASFWAIPPAVVTECFTVLSGSGESSAFARTCVLRVANLGGETEIRLAPLEETMAVPVGASGGLLREEDGGWVASQGRGEERIFRLLSTESLTGVVQARLRGQRELRVVNASRQTFRDAVFVEGGRAWSIPDVLPDMKTVYSVKEAESMSISEALGSGEALWQRALLRIAETPGLWLLARIDRYPKGPDVPGTAPGDPHPSLLVLRASRAGKP